MKKRKRRTRKHRNSKKSYSEPKTKQQNHVAGCDRHPGGLSAGEKREENAVQGHPWLQSEFKASLAYSVYRKTKPYKNKHCKLHQEVNIHKEREAV